MAAAAQKVQDVQPLKIIVVGAGIAGLCTAVALRQAGHNVEVRAQYPSQLVSRIAMLIGVIRKDLREIQVRD